MSEILKALNTIMSKVGYVQKRGSNQHHGYRYATEADLLSAVRPLMVEHGLLLMPSIARIDPIDEYGNTTVVMEYTLAHVSGEVWPDKIRAVGCGNDRNRHGVGDKGAFKAVTGANKYLISKLFQIETGDDPEDDGAEAPPERPAEERKVSMPVASTADPVVDFAIVPPEGDFANVSRQAWEVFAKSMIVAVQKLALNKDLLHDLWVKNKATLEALEEFGPDLYTGVHREFADKKKFIERRRT